MHDELPSGIQEMIDGLRLNTSSDFCGLACLNGTMLRWKYTSGASNERVKRMEMRPDKIWWAQPFGLDAQPDLMHNPPGASPGRCPLMLAERLVCAIAVPVFQEGSVPAPCCSLGQQTALHLLTGHDPADGASRSHLQPKVFG